MPKTDDVVWNGQNYVTGTMWFIHFSYYCYGWS